MIMSLNDFSCLCTFIVFAQLTESRVLILREYDDEPLVLGHMDSSNAEEVKHKHKMDDPAISSNYKPKRARSKKTVLQYGRHIYHLDNFADLKDLRSKMTQFKPDSVSYDYVDIGGLIQDSDSAKIRVRDYLKELFIYSNKPLQFCSGDQCDEDLRKFSKHKNDDDTDWKHKNMQFGRMKRFRIVDNGHKSEKPQSDPSEESHEKKEQKPSKKNKRKKMKHSSESAESKSKESGSEEKSWGSHKKKKIKPSKSSEGSVEIKRKPKKKHNDDHSASASVQKWKNHEKDSKSNEDLPKKKMKKLHNYGASDETKRKTYTTQQKGVEYDFFMQGNKIFPARARRTKKKHYDFDKRRRLEHFLPKRYHWDPSEIHDLGYYWFNGPKGQYAAPKTLSK